MGRPVSGCEMGPDGDNANHTRSSFGWGPTNMRLHAICRTQCIAVSVGQRR